MRFAPYYVGGLILIILVAAILGVYPSIIVLGIIIILSFTIVLMVMRVGTHDDEPLGEPSKSIAFWSKLADKVEARSSGELQTASVAATAATGAVSDEAEKERKRQEAQARKAARQAKSTGSEA